MNCSLQVVVPDLLQPDSMIMQGIAVKGDEIGVILACAVVFAVLCVCLRLFSGNKA